MKETKELLGLGFAIANAVGASLEDGKVDWTDIPKFTSVLGELASGVIGIDKVPAELKALTEVEYKELLDYAKAEFDIPQDEVEAKVELAFDVGFKLAQLVLTFAKKDAA